MNPLLMIIVVGGILSLGLLGFGLWFVIVDRGQKLTDQDDSGMSVDNLPLQTPAAVPSGRQGNMSQPASAFPPGLSRPYARRPLTISNALVILGLGLLWTVVMLGLFGWGVSEWHEYTLLRDSGVATEAVVLDRYTRQESSNSGRQRRTRTVYYLTYRYTANLPEGGQQEFTTQEKVSRSAYEAHDPESRTTILYAASRPDLSTLQSELTAPPFILPFVAFNGIFALFGFFLLFLGGSGLQKALALNSRGRLTSGLIFDRWIRRKGGFIGSRYYYVAYYFQDPRLGYDHQQITRAEANRTAYELLNKGDPVQIRYLPDKPKVCRLEL